MKKEKRTEFVDKRISFLNYYCALHSSSFGRNSHITCFFLLAHTQITYKIKKNENAHTHTVRTFIHFPNIHFTFFLCVFKGNSVEREHLKRKSTPPNRTSSPRFIFCLNLWNLKICENVCWISIEIPFLWCQSKNSVKPAWSMPTRKKNNSKWKREREKSQVEKNAN